MSAPAISKRLLDPTERASEVLFGLIMVLTVTGFQVIIVSFTMALTRIGED